jgi:hypothetical protein
MQINKKISLRKVDGFSVIVDETQDKKYRAVINILITPSAIDYPLNDDFRLKSILINTLFLNTTVDSNAIVRETNKVLANSGLNFDKITAFVSDNAAYMIKAFKTFKVLWPNSIHITCHSHIFNLVAETFRYSFIEIDEFMAKMKSFFKKSRIRRKIYFETCGKAIPKTSLTRWNSWLEAIIIHENLFKFYGDLIKNLTTAKISSPVIPILRRMIEKPILYQQIKFIKSISQPIIDAVLSTQRQDIMTTDIFKYCSNLMAIFREMYANIDINEDYLNIYRKELNEYDFSLFKQSVIDCLNQTLL